MMTSAGARTCCSRQSVAVAGKPTLTTVPWRQTPVADTQPLRRCGPAAVILVSYAFHVVPSTLYLALLRAVTPKASFSLSVWPTKTFPSSHVYVADTKERQRDVSLNCRSTYFDGRPITASVTEVSHAHPLARAHSTCFDWQVDDKNFVADKCLQVWTGGQDVIVLHIMLVIEILYLLTRI